MDYIWSMDLESFKCPKCEFTHQNLNSLRIHWQKSHNEQSINLRIALFGRSTCECGCGEVTDYRGLVVGFARFVNGHNARVNNGWGHNKKALEKSLKKRLKMFERGEIKPWATGKSKDHPQNIKRVQNMQKTVLSDPNELRRRSIQMKQDRLSGRIPTQYGKNSSQWKGGTSALQPLVRSRVFNVWTYPKLKEANFTCQKCGSRKNLEVHHTHERFADILWKAIQALGEPGNDFERKVVISDWVADYHIDNDVPGNVLCEGCHLQEHQAAG